MKEAQHPSPESVITSIIHALNEGQVDQAVSFVAEDVVVILLPSPPGVSGIYLGKTALRKRYEQYIADHEWTALSNFETRGKLASWSATLSADTFRTLGLSALESRAYGVVQDGLLKTYTWVITDESLALLERAIKG